MKALLKSAQAALLVASMIACAGCQEAGETDGVGADTTAVDTSMQAEPMQQMAVAQLEPTSGSNVRGSVQFMSQNGDIHATGTITGLEAGEHGIHIHQNGDCSNNGEAAGPHWSGPGTEHGAPTDAMPQRHAGDMGNIEADESGNADFDQTLALNMPLDSLVGKAVIVHAQRDDLESQPSGNSGARVSCGVIQMGGDAGMGADTTGMGADTTDL